MIAPEGKTVYVNGKRYKSGKELPAGVKLKEEKTAKVSKPKTEPEVKGEA